MHTDTDRRTRRRLLIALAAGLGLPGAVRQLFAQEQAANGAIAQGMRSVTGEVRVNGRVAAAGTPVQAGDRVMTGRQGIAMFVVGQDAFLLRGGSRAEFAGAGVLIDVARLVTGGLLAVFGGGAHRIVTPTATIGLRGTGGYTEARQDRTYFCLCYGEAEIATTDGRVRDAYSTTHHESPRYIYGARRRSGNRKRIVPAGVTNHTDTELIMLEALAGRRPPAAFMDSPQKY